MPITLTREQATAAVAAAVAERDAIQANLLELDGSFGKRLLAGASLAGETRRRWEAAAAELTTLWETFTAYSAVVDRADEILAAGRPAGARLAEITTLLNAGSVRLTQAAAPLASRNLTATGTVALTLAAAVREMRRGFADVASVVTAAETVWNEISGRLQQAGADLAAARRSAGELADESLAGALALAQADLGQLRDLLNSDPLSLWHPGGVDVSRVDRLRGRTAAATARAGELAALRDDADRRIAAVTAVVSAARAAWQDCQAARQQAAAKIAAEAAPAPPPVAGLAGRQAALDELKAAGRWSRLAAELDGLGRQAAAVAEACRDSERQARALLDRRDELRGLLDAYRAQAAGLGAAEDAELDTRYDAARELLWYAPCDLAAAADAVGGYQQAVRALRGRGQRP